MAYNYKRERELFGLLDEQTGDQRFRNYLIRTLSTPGEIKTPEHAEFLNKTLLEVSRRITERAFALEALQAPDAA